MMSDNFVLAFLFSSWPKQSKLLDPKRAYFKRIISLLFIKINLIQQKLVKYKLKYYHFSVSIAFQTSLHLESVQPTLKISTTTKHCKMQNVIVLCTASKLFSMYATFRRYSFTNTQSRPCRWTSSKKFTVVENRKLGKIILPFQIYRS